MELSNCQPLQFVISEPKNGDEKVEKMTLLQAIKAYLLIQGETSIPINDYKKLTEEDKKDLRTWFGEMGIEIVSQVPATT